MRRYLLTLVIFFCLIPTLNAGGVEDLVQNSISKVCRIKTVFADGQLPTTGAGFVVHENGLIITCSHVATTPQVIVMFDDGEEYLGDVLWAKQTIDSALIKITPNKKLSTFTFTDKRLKLGQKFITIGHPLGLEYTVSQGIISNLNREGLDTGSFVVKHAIQLYSGICPGNSGGPIIGMDGKLLGLVFAHHTKGEGIGFGIPYYQFKPYCDEMFNRKSDLPWKPVISKTLGM